MNAFYLFVYVQKTRSFVYHACMIISLQLLQIFLNFANILKATWYCVFCRGVAHSD